MDKEEILGCEWPVQDERKGVAAFASFMAECVMPWDIRSWIEALAENHKNYPGWETKPEIVKDFIDDMLF